MSSSRPLSPIEVSVVTPAYAPVRLDRLVASLNAQSFANFEWIVVDDASPEGFDQAFRQASRESLRPVNLIRLESNGGPARARNVGLAAARGSYVKFIDADDTIDENHLALLHRAAEEAAGQGQVVFASTRHVIHPGRAARPKIRINTSHRTLPAGCGEQLVQHFRAPFLSHCGALFPIRLLQDLKGYNESLVTDEDGDLLARVLMAGHSFRAVEGTFYDYHHRKDVARVSVDDSEAKIRSRVDACLWMLQAAAGCFPHLQDELRRAGALRLDRIATSALRLDRQLGRDIFARARSLSRNYATDLPRWEHALRMAMGVNMGVPVTAFLRRLSIRVR